MLGALQSNSLIAMVSGLLLWSLYFLFSYSLLSLGCALGVAQIRMWGQSLVHLMILGVTLLTLLTMGYLAWRSWQQYQSLTKSVLVGEAAGAVRRRRFMALVALMIHGLGAVALLWVAAPVLLGIPPCL